jgi:hypothetical protein
MESIDGIAELHMSGARAVFVPAKGVRIDETTVAAAFEEQGMKLESYREVLRPRAKARYLADAGVT